MDFDYKRFASSVSREKGLYGERNPYPFAVFDGLFDDALLEAVNSEISIADFRLDDRAIEGIEVKVRSDFDDNESVPRSCRRVFDVLNGGKFLALVSQLTGIDGLISDPYFDGGGINAIKSGGTLAVHVDGTTQRRMQVCRRLNAILFLNEEWNENWNGYHEQWDFEDKELSPFDPGQKWKCIRKILPKKNRLVIFTTNDFSWHGHAGVLEVPEGIERRSLITYYYTSTRPDSDIRFENPHRALFIDNSVTLKDEAFLETEFIL